MLAPDLFMFEEAQIWSNRWSDVLNDWEWVLNWRSNDGWDNTAARIWSKIRPGYRWYQEFWEPLP